jgi:hypothetical protein
MVVWDLIIYGVTCIAPWRLFFNVDTAIQCRACISVSCNCLWSEVSFHGTRIGDHTLRVCGLSGVWRLGILGSCSIFWCSGQFDLRKGTGEERTASIQQLKIPQFHLKFALLCLFFVDCYLYNNHFAGCFLWSLSKRYTYLQMKCSVLEPDV